MSLFGFFTTTPSGDCADYTDDTKDAMPHGRKRPDDYSSFSASITACVSARFMRLCGQ